MPSILHDNQIIAVILTGLLSAGLILLGCWGAGGVVGILSILYAIDES